MTAHILILCTHNSARSILAEGMLNHLAARFGRDIRAHSAGSAPSGRVNPLALGALRDAGVATEDLRSKSWDAFTGRDAPDLAAVITVCDNAAGEACPVFRGWKGREPVRAHWGFPDPSLAEGGLDGQRRAFELTRLALGFRLLQLVNLPLESMAPQDLHAALVAIGRS